MKYITTTDCSILNIKIRLTAMIKLENIFRILLFLVFLYPCYSQQESVKEILYLPSYGQSLSVGWTGIPVISPGNGLGNIMFKSGIRPYETGNDRSEFVPLGESASPDKAKGETPLSGAVDSFISFSNVRDKRFLCSANGIGGISITGLGKNSNAYGRIIQDLEAGKELAAKKHQRFNMPGFIWTQGETDQINKQSKEWYKEKMLNLIRTMDHDAKKITNQKNDVLCFGYQVSSHLAYFDNNPTEYPTIAIAQLELALDEKSNYIMTTPMYHFSYSDAVHLPAVMSRLYGVHVGYVMKQVLIDRKKWKPLHPVSHRINKSENSWEIKLSFHVPSPPLVLDTETVLPPDNYGFSLVDFKGNPLKIKSIKLIDKTTLGITTDENPIEAHIRYGMTIKEKRKSGPTTGARGNLRDSQGNTVTFDIEGETYRIDNWCPFFDYPLINSNAVK